MKSALKVSFRYSLNKRKSILIDSYLKIKLQKNTKQNGNNGGKKIKKEIFRVKKNQTK